MGTPLYVAPEMLTDCKALPAGDLWALGVIAYKLYTGKVPFAAESQDKTFEKILSLDYQWPDSAENAEIKDFV